MVSSLDSEADAVPFRMGFALGTFCGFWFAMSFIGLLVAMKGPLGVRDTALMLKFYDQLRRQNGSGCDS